MFVTLVCQETIATNQSRLVTATPHALVMKLAAWQLDHLSASVRTHVPLVLDVARESTRVLATTHVLHHKHAQRLMVS